MTLIQVFLMCYFVMPNLSTTVSQQDVEELEEFNKTRNVMEYVSPTIEKLINEYVAKVLEGKKTDVSQPLGGITLPVGNNTEQIRASACAIQAYLKCLPPIIREFVRRQHRRHLIKRLEEIKNQLSGIPLRIQQCGGMQHTNLGHLGYKKPEGKYEEKRMGLRILQNVDKWVKSFIEDFSPGGSSGSR